MVFSIERPLKRARHVSFGVFLDAVISGDLAAVKNMINSPEKPNNEICYDYAYAYKRHDMVEFFIDSGLSGFSISIVHQYAKEGNDNVFMKFMTHFPNLVSIELLDLIIDTAKCLQYTEMLIGRLNTDVIKNSPLLTAAVMKDNIDLVKFYHNYGVEYTEWIYCEVRSLKVLMYIYEVMRPVCKELDLMLAAAELYNMECVYYLLIQGYVINAKFVAESAKTDDVELIRFLHNVGLSWGEFDVSDIFNEDVGKYCHNNDIPEKWVCYDTCFLCEEKAINELWIMEENQYDNMIQWLPAEIMDDLLLLLN